jgi:hypothetical protein
MQVVRALEPRAAGEAADIVWRGAVLLAALDGGREAWVRQGAGGGGAELFYFVRAQQGGCS